MMGKHSKPEDTGNVEAVDPGSIVEALTTGFDRLPTEPTQVQHPWKATIRTGIAVLIGVLSVIPVVVATAGIGTVPAVAQVVAVTAAITRVMALPQVNELLSKFGLGAT